MKKPTYLFLSLLGLTLFLPLGKAVLAAPSLHFEPSAVDALKGDTLSINLVGSELEDIYAYQFSISYNPEILKAVDVQEGDFLATAGSTFFISGAIDDIAGVINFTGNSLIGDIAGVNGNGILAIFGFEAITPGISSLVLNDILFLNSTFGEVSVSASDGTIEVTDCGSVLGSAVGSGKCIDNGTMTVDANNQVVTGTLDLGTTGGVIDSNGNNGTVSGAISGTGSLSKVGLGVLTLSGVNTYSGGTDLNGGTLSVSDESNLGDMAGALTFDGGVLQITGTAFTSTLRTINWGAAGGGFDIADPGNLFTVSQVLSGSGGVVKEGDGTLLLTGANTYTGGTTVNAGILQGNASSLQGDINNNAAVVFDQADGGIYSGVMGGTGALLKQNTGSLALTGANTYNGGTIVNQGILSVQGSLASGVTVNSGGTLRGTGSITGDTTIAGRLAPGNSPGTLTVNGSVAMAASSTLAIDIDGTGTGNGAGNYSRVLVQGAGHTFTAAGGLQPLLRSISGAANNTFTPVIGQNFTIVNAAGGIQGTFNALAQPLAGLPSGARVDALYDTNTVRLAITPQFYNNLPNIALIGNASVVGAMLDTVRPDAFAAKNPLFQGLATLSEPEVATALQQLDGEIHADLLAASFTAHRLAGQAVSGRLADVRLGRPSSTAAMMAQNTGGAVGLAANQAAQTLAAEANKNVWVRGLGGFMSTHSDKQASGFNERLYGVMLGADFAVAEPLQLGAAVGYVHNQVGASQSGAGATDSIQFLGYGLWHKNSEFLNFSFGYGRDNYTSQRTVNLGGATGYQADVDGNSGSLEIEAGTRRQLGQYIIEPSFGVRGDIISRNAITEDGLAGLAVKATTLTAAQTRLGAKLSRAFGFGANNRITPEFRVYWLHDEGDSIASRSSATLLGQQISASAADAGRDAAALGGGVTVDLGDNVALFADYNFEQRNARNGQNVLGGLRLSW
ncbi:MAG: autotransporter domain-containing protein [Methylococcales bacterium]|nr:autotransporter domain-containing protein [Methylococcales bacterium]